MPNITQIPAPRVPFIDERTGTISREWFRFLNNVYTIIGGENQGVIAPENGGTGSSLIPANGQIPIGDGAKYIPANLTQGAGLTVTNGAGSVTVAVANTGVTAGSYGSASAVPNYTVNAQGQLTAAATTSIGIDAAQVTSGTLPIARGGTNTNAAPTAGTVAYGTGTAIAYNTAGTAGYPLVSGGASAPSWVAPSTLSVGSATTATNLASGSLGTIPYQTAAGTTAMLAAGTSGQVLTSVGTAAPTWAAPNLGALIFLSSVTATNAATVSLETGISSTYDNYLILCDNLKFNSGSGSFYVQFKVGGTYVTTGNMYYYSVIYADTAGAASLSVWGGNAVNTAYISEQAGSNNGLGALEFKLLNANSSATMKNSLFHGSIQSATSGRPSTLSGTVTCAETGVVTGVRFIHSAASLSGSFYLYGYTKS